MFKEDEKGSLHQAYAPDDEDVGFSGELDIRVEVNMHRHVAGTNDGFDFSMIDTDFGTEKFRRG
ncbi:hypothetical protein EYZ11_009417 [Aspergillus tanneri]|uniref:Uncharacterized protein n=1 Tax=Aspergillus tanneri TaxID=1220188 RepID=A0A4S3JA42_9EURO|nr:hypothetical protein EYZ11_009417 [Aspergillus tanneri]